MTSNPGAAFKALTPDELLDRFNRAGCLRKPAYHGGPFIARLVAEFGQRGALRQLRAAYDDPAAPTHWPSPENMTWRSSLYSLAKVCFYLPPDIQIAYEDAMRGLREEYNTEPPVGDFPSPPEHSVRVLEQLDADFRHTWSALKWENQGLLPEEAEVAAALNA